MHLTINIVASTAESASDASGKNYDGLTIHLGDLNAGYIIKLADGLGFLKEEFVPAISLFL